MNDKYCSYMGNGSFCILPVGHPGDHVYASEPINRCPIVGPGGQQCTLSASHWPMTHETAGHKKFARVNGLVTLIRADLDFCDQTTPDGDPCTRVAGHPGSHQHDPYEFGNPAELEDFKSGNEPELPAPPKPELPAPPKPVKRLSIGYSEKGKGKIVLCCVPQVADTIRAANVGVLSASIDPAHAMEYTLFISIDLFDFDGMVDWLISLA